MLDFCVALEKADTFRSSPRAGFLSFDFHYDVYPMAMISDKKEKANPRVGVRCQGAVGCSTPSLSLLSWGRARRP